MRALEAFCFYWDTLYIDRVWGGIGGIIDRVWGGIGQIDRVWAVLGVLTMYGAVLGDVMFQGPFDVVHQLSIKRRVLDVS